MAKTYKVVVLKGDTLKPEVTGASVEIFKQFTKSSFNLDFSYGEAGYRFIAHNNCSQRWQNQND